LLVALGAASAAAADGGASAAPCTVADESPFTLALRALTDPRETELAATVTPRPAACGFPEALKNIQVKTFSLAGELIETRTIKAMPAPGGHAIVHLPQLHRNQRLELVSLVQTEDTVRTVVLRGATPVRLRPDLAVTSLDVPSQIVSGKAFTVEASVGELKGDIAVTAEAVLRRGDSGAELGSKQIEVDAGGTTTVSFPLILAGSGAVPLELTLLGASVAEVGTANNRREAPIELLQFELQPSTTLVPSIAGYGGQFNQHVYSKLSMPPVDEQNVLDMEHKMIALQPNMARIFINGSAFLAANPDRLASFYRTADLARRAGSQIIVNWQGGILTTTNMQRFSEVVLDLLKNRGHERLWVSLFNEPNTTTGITTEVYESSWRTFDARMHAAGVRDRLSYMGAEITLDKQAAWFAFLSTRMGDLLDAWSVHIYWDWWDTPKITSRFAGIRALVAAIPAEQRRPLYVSEYAVRGLKNCGGVAQVDPGSWSDCTPLTQTVANGWHHAWLSLASSRFGYLGALKWDSYWGKYDNGTQAYYMLGSPLVGWPAYPVYWTTRLLTMTTRPGWAVLGGGLDGEHKLVTAYAGPAGELSVIGMDTGDPEFKLADELADYTIGSLPPSATFRVVTWNGATVGALADEGVIVANADGVVHLTAHRHAVWALTTLPAGV
jgi:hypothetical protein